MKMSYVFGFAIFLVASLSVFIWLDDGGEKPAKESENHLLSDSTETIDNETNQIVQMPVLPNFIQVDNPTPVWKNVQPDREPIQRNYVNQPPLIPHTIENYQINLQSNKCLTCHSWSNYKEANATKISTTHFKDREGNVLANLAPRRYFCTQCHVPQFDAKPLVENTFEPIQILKTQQ
jgi:nitrate reductase cytochrome c-type subunit